MRDKKTEKRIATGVKVDESEISPRTKKIKNFEKAQTVEKLRMELMYKMTSIAPEINYNADAILNSFKHCLDFDSTKTAIYYRRQYRRLFKN